MRLIRRWGPVAIAVILLGTSLRLAYDRGATEPTWGTVILAVIAGFCAGVLTENWLTRRELGHRQQFVDQQQVVLADLHTIPSLYRGIVVGEVELFTTTTPDAFPPGTIWPGESVPAGTYAGFVAPAEGNYTVTRLHDLGSFSDIHGKRHRQWRVYGRPADA